MPKNLTEALARAAYARSFCGITYTPEQRERMMSAPAERTHGHGPMLRLAA